MTHDINAKITRNERISANLLRRIGRECIGRDAKETAETYTNVIGIMMAEYLWLMRDFDTRNGTEIAEQTKAGWLTHIENGMTMPLDVVKKVRGGVVLP